MKSNCICVNVNAPPVDGEANRELIKYISSLLRLQENQLKIERVMEDIFMIFSWNHLLIYSFFII